MKFEAVALAVRVGARRGRRSLRWAGCPAVVRGSGFVVRFRSGAG